MTAAPSPKEVLLIDRDMWIWLTTVRAVPDRSAVVSELLREQLMPLLRGQPGCAGPTLATCIHCADEFTYLARWHERDALERFEASPPYRVLIDRLSTLLRTPPKRELWRVLVT